MKVEDYRVPDKGDEKWSDSGYILKKANRKIWHKKREESKMTPWFLASAN